MAGDAHFGPYEWNVDLDDGCIDPQLLSQPNNDLSALGGATLEAVGTHTGQQVADQATEVLHAQDAPLLNIDDDVLEAIHREVATRVPVDHAVPGVPSPTARNGIGNIMGDGGTTYNPMTGQQDGQYLTPKRRPPASRSSRRSVVSATSRVSSRASTATYTCLQCGKLCVGKTVFNKHQYKHIPMKERTYGCPIEGCEYKANYPKDIRRHVERTKKHNLGALIYCDEAKCPYSEIGFIREDHMDKHRQRAHQQPAVGRPEPQPQHPNAEPNTPPAQLQFQYGSQTPFNGLLPRMQRHAFGL